MMKDFLGALWGDGPLGELRMISNGHVEQDFFRAPEELQAAAEQAVLEDHDWNKDVYFGVVPRTRTEGTADATVDMALALWADVDSKNTGGKDAALHGLLALAQPPSIIVDSGHGYHGYWLLEQPSDWVDAQRAMKNIAREVRGDAVHDRSRILRVPGTRNHKDADLFEVRLLKFDLTRKYRIDDFDLRDYERRVSLTVEHQARGNVEDLPVWLIELIGRGVERGQRSEASFKVVIWGLRYGFSDEDIEGWFIENPDGIGAKYHELGLGSPRWFARTLAAASEEA